MKNLDGILYDGANLNLKQRETSQIVVAKSTNANIPTSVPQVDKKLAQASG